MIHTTAIAFFLGLWASVYLIDSYLRQRFPVGYAACLDKTGISFGICQMRWSTSTLNRFIFKLAQIRPKLLTLWLNCGVAMALISMPLAVGILLHTLALNFVPWSTSASSSPSPSSSVSSFTSDDHSSSSSVAVSTTAAATHSAILTPVMPGINLPMNQFSYYMITLLICGILHELGHAVAAVKENVRISECGVFLFAIYPGAYVKLYSEHIAVIKPLQQLRVYCGGVWHNFVMVLAAVAVLFTLPWLLSPLFVVNGMGIVVTDVVQGSAVSGRMGLYPGDVITSLDVCPVYNVNDWLNCIKGSMKTDVVKGYCMSIDKLTSPEAVNSHYRNGSSQVEYDEYGIGKCCLGNLTNSHVCFSYDVKSSMRYSCLSARQTTLKLRCRSHMQCQGQGAESERRPRGPYHYYCASPVVHNETRLLRVRRRSPDIIGGDTSGDTDPANHAKRSTPVLKDYDVLFFGHPLDLYYAVTFSDYVPKYRYVPHTLPYVIATYCKYIISLSGALALLNVIPCYELDGQHILQATIELTLKDVLSPNVRQILYRSVMAFGTSLLIANLLVALRTLFTS